MSQGSKIIVSAALNPRQMAKLEVIRKHYGDAPRSQILIRLLDGYRGQYPLYSPAPVNLEASHAEPDASAEE